MAERVVLYARISQDREGAGLGVDRQLEDCRALAAARGWVVVAELTDNDISAWSGKRRPGYEKLLAAIEADQTDHVIAWHTDRLHRNPSELEHYVSSCDTHRVTTSTVKAGDLDLSTASGLLVARMFGAIARHESDQKAERIRRARQQEAAAGKLHGSLGYGWRKVRGKWAVHEQEAAVLRDAADRLLSGEPLGSIVRDLNERGVPTPGQAQWTDKTVRRAAAADDGAGLPDKLVGQIRARLDEVEEEDRESMSREIARDLRHRGVTPPRMYWRSPNLRQLILAARLCGYREWTPKSQSGQRGDITARGDWPAILDRDQTERLRELLLDPQRRTISTRESGYLLTGILRCGTCGAPMQGRMSRRSGTDGERVLRYGCTAQPGLDRCGANSILGQPIEAMVSEAVIARLTGSRLRKARQTKANVDVDALLAEIDQAEGIMMEMAEDRAAGRMTASEWGRAREVAERRIDKARLSMASHTAARALVDLPTASASELRTWWDETPVDRRRAVLTSLIVEVVVTKGQKGRPFDPLRLGDPVWRV